MRRIKSSVAVRKKSKWGRDIFADFRQPFGMKGGF